MSDETPDPAEAPEPPPPTRRRKAGGGLAGESLGGMLAGFDQLVMRTQPPPHELVHKGAPVRGLTGEDGSDLVLGFPEDAEGRLPPPEPSTPPTSPGD